MYKFTSFSLYFSFFLSVSGFFHVYFFKLIFFLKFSSDYWGGKKGVLPPHPNYWGGACPGCPPQSTPMRMYTGPESRSGTQGKGMTSWIALTNAVACCRWPRMSCDMSGHRYCIIAVE